MASRRIESCRAKAARIASRRGLPQLCRPFDVGKQERHGPRWCPHRPILPRRVGATLDIIRPPRPARNEDPQLAGESRSMSTPALSRKGMPSGGSTSFIWGSKLFGSETPDALRDGDLGLRGHGRSPRTYLPSTGREDRNGVASGRTDSRERSGGGALEVRSVADIAGPGTRPTVPSVMKAPPRGARLRRATVLRSPRAPVVAARSGGHPE